MAFVAKGRQKKAAGTAALSGSRLPFRGILAMQDAKQAARMESPATFCTLRHTYASHLVQASTTLLYVASALGHRDAHMVGRHYGHFAPSQVAETIRANLPTFGRSASRRVRSISSRRTSCSDSKVRRAN